MEDKSPLITVKTEIKEEILEDESIETDRLGVHEEHNYNKNQLHHSMNIKEESDYYTEIENSYSSEIAENETVSDVQTQENILMATNYCDNKQIKAEKYAVNLKTLEKDKAMGTETFGSSATLLTEQNQFINIIKKEVPTKSSRKQQKLKKEDFDYELAELHHSINIKEEVEFMETENIVLEDDYNLDTVRPFLDSQYYPTMNNQHSRNNTRASSLPASVNKLKLRKSRINCCVVGCSNAYFNSNVKFYGFPNKWYEKERKKIWIDFVKKTQKLEIEKMLWFPKTHSKICSDHFIGHKRSNNSFSPSYIPTILPTVI